MESSEFLVYFEKFPILKKLFSGPCSIDTIPSTLKLYHFLICNTDVSSGHGKHWFCLLRSAKTEIECFDSLGVSEDKKKLILEYLNVRGVRNVKVNTSPVQLPSTDTCGKFCIMFIFERLHNLDMDFDELLNSIFSDDCGRNETILHSFIEDLFD